MSLELLVGVVSGVLVVLVVLLVVVIWLCCKRVATVVKVESDAGDTEVLSEVHKEDQPDTPASDAAAPVAAADAKEETAGELESLLGEEPEILESPKHKFSAPIWLEEIQKNKIFNKQKSIISSMTEEREGGGEVGGADKADVGRQNGQTTAVPEEGLTPVVLPAKEELEGSSNDEVRESSRTESDEDFNNQEDNNNKTNDIDKDIDELQTLLKKVHEQEKALND